MYMNNFYSLNYYKERDRGKEFLIKKLRIAIKDWTDQIVLEERISQN